MNENLCLYVNLYTGKQCKNIYDFNIGIKNLCKNHCILLYTKYALIIQKIYKGYKCRRYLNNIFFKLPNDVQDIILNKINKDLYYKQYYKTINKIIYNNVYKLHNYKFSADHFSISYILNCYKLYIKYHKIISLKYLKHLKILGDQLLYLCDCILSNDSISTYHAIYFNLNLNIITYVECGELYSCITKYLMTYYYYYYY